jgi:hypothetical protein
MKSETLRRANTPPKLIVKKTGVSLKFVPHIAVALAMSALVTTGTTLVEIRWL